MGVPRTFLLAAVVAAGPAYPTASWELEPRSLEALKAMSLQPPADATAITVSWPPSMLRMPASHAPLPFFAASDRLSSSSRRGRVLAQADLNDLMMARSRASLSLLLAGRVWDAGAAFDPDGGVVLLELLSQDGRRIWAPVWKMGEGLGLGTLSRLRKGIVVSLGRGAAYRFRVAYHPLSFREPLSLEIDPVPPSKYRRYALSLRAVIAALGRGGLAFKASGRSFLALCGRDADFKRRRLRDSASLLILEASAGGALMIPIERLARAPFEVRWDDLVFVVGLEPSGRLVISERNSVE